MLTHVDIEDSDVDGALAAWRRVADTPAGSSGSHQESSREA
jgi:hypothetical protein